MTVQAAVKQGGVLALEDEIEVAVLAGVVASAAALGGIYVPYQGHLCFIAFKEGYQEKILAIEAAMQTLYPTPDDDGES